MRETGRLQEGAGGSTFVANSGPASFAKQAPAGSVYVEFNAPRASLIQGGQDDWFKAVGPGASKSMRFMLEKQGGELLPQVKKPFSYFGIEAMTFIDSRLETAQAAFSAQFGDTFEMKVISASNGDFGDLKGIQFDSDQCGGYLYFWSSGVIEYHLVDYELGDEVIPITTCTEHTDVGFEANISKLILAIADINGKTR